MELRAAVIPVVLQRFGIPTAHYRNGSFRSHLYRCGTARMTGTSCELHALVSVIRLFLEMLELGRPMVALITT